jgi:hypothetical protein
MKVLVPKRKKTIKENEEAQISASEQQIYLVKELMEKIEAALNAHVQKGFIELDGMGRVPMKDAVSTIRENELENVKLAADAGASEMIYRAIVDNIGENAVASRLSRLRNRK